MPDISIRHGDNLLFTLTKRELYLMLLATFHLIHEQSDMNNTTSKEEVDLAHHINDILKEHEGLFDNI